MQPHQFGENCNGPGWEDYQALTRSRRSIANFQGPRPARLTTTPCLVQYLPPAATPSTPSAPFVRAAVSSTAPSYCSSGPQPWQSALPNRMAAAVDLQPGFGTPGLASAGISMGYFDTDFGGMDSGNEFSDNFTFDMPTGPAVRVQDTVYPPHALPNLAAPGVVDMSTTQLPNLDIASAGSGHIFEHGQITPLTPDDARSMWQSMGDSRPTPSIKQEDVGKSPCSPKRKRSSASDDTQTGNKRRRSRKSASVSNAESDLLDPVEDGKRNKFLERNRVAASKCRQKKKEWTQKLEAQARTLQTQKTQLSALVESLRNEAMWLKGEMLRHTDCSCTHIREYLSREAETLASGGQRSPHQAVAGPTTHSHSSPPVENPEPSSESNASASPQSSTSVIDQTQRGLDERSSQALAEGC